MLKIFATLAVILVLVSLINADETAAVTKPSNIKNTGGESEDSSEENEKTLTGRECCGILDTKCCCMDKGGECLNYGIATLFKENQCSPTKYCGGCERGWKC